MADPKNLLEEATARAVLAAGRDAAKRAAVDLLSTDEERAAAQAEDARAAKRKRWRLIGLVVLGLFVLIGLIGMLVSYWHWFLLVGLGGIAGLLGYQWLKRRMAARKQAVSRRIETPSSKMEVRAPERVAAPEAEARAPIDDVLAEADASAEAVDEELAALKARLGQSRRGT
jgi:hypothetical protein